MQPVRVNAQPVRKRMSPVPNDNPITPLIRRSSKSSSSIIELNSDVENTTSLLDDYCRSAILHQGCRTTDFHLYEPPFYSNPAPRAETRRSLEALCRARHHGARQHVELRGTKDRGAAARRTAREQGTRKHRELRGTMGHGNTENRAAAWDAATRRTERHHGR